jgi:hypothetical protein
MFADGLFRKHTIWMLVAHNLQKFRTFLSMYVIDDFQAILLLEYVEISGVLKVASCEDYTHVPGKHYFIYNHSKQSTHLVNDF